MQIHLIAIGQKMPSWISTGYNEYAQRLPPQCALKLIEIPAEKRNKNTNTKKALEKEGTRMLSVIPKNAVVIAMDINGQYWDTPKLAKRLDDWMHDGRDIALLIGGADGLDPACKQISAFSWSLSALTFPHPLVRVLLAEQLYRAWSILNNHPYHRGDVKIRTNINEHS